MSVNVIYRNPKPQTCPDCGLGGLELVATATGGKVTPSNPNGYTGWRYVPAGTDDFSGTYHPVMKCNGKVNASNVAAPPMAAPAPATIDPDIEKRIERLERKVIDLKPSTADGTAPKRIEDIEAKVNGYSDAINEIVDGLTEVKTTINDKLKVMRDEIAAFKIARPVSVTFDMSKPPVNVGRQHRQYENVLTAVKAIGDSGFVFLPGPGGSGKSSLFEGVAKGLGVDWSAQTMNALTMADGILGFISPVTGKYVRTDARDAYEFGKLHAFDEVTRATAEGASSINGITANKVTGFPDGLVTRHPNCYFIAAANNYGRGADDQYIGAMQLDAATLCRAFYIPIEYDWDFMADMWGVTIKGDPDRFRLPGKPRPITDPVVQGWGQMVKDITDALPECDIKTVIGPRAFINGLKCLMAGMDEAMVRFGTLWGHMDVDAGIAIRNKLGLTE